MVVAAIIPPKVINFTGTNEIVQGSDFFFEWVVTDIDDAVVNLTGVTASTDLKCEFRTATLQQDGVTTGCPVPTMYISNASQGKVLLHLGNSTTRQALDQILTGKWDCELMLGGFKYRIAGGDWKIDALQVTSRYNP